MSKTLIDVIVEIYETEDDWYLRVEWYGQETIWQHFATAGDALNKAIRTYPDMTMRAEIIPYKIQEAANA
jgi:hypothetical protein